MISTRNGTGRTARATAGRAGWTLVDQFLSAATNLGVGVFVARHASTDEYGVFGVAFAVYAVALGVSRALATDPLVVRFSATAREERAPVRAAVGTAIAVGAVLGGATAIAALAIGGRLAPALFATGLLLPGLLAQDALRYAAFAEGHPFAAVCNDGTWVAFLIVAFAVPARDVTTAAPCLVAWAAAAVAAAVVSAAGMRLLPSVAAATEWLRSHRDLAPRFAAEFILTSGGLQLVLFATATVAGYSDAGALRGASVLLGPMTVVSAGAVAAAVPELVRAHANGVGLVKPVVLLAAALAAGTVAWAVVASMLPNRVGTALLGDTWHTARDIIVPLGIAAGANAAATGFTVGLRSLAAARRSLRAAMPSVALVVTGGITGAAIDGAFGAAVGMILPMCASAALFARQFRLAVVQGLR